MPATLQTVEIKGAGRHYLCQDGQLRASVTTILGAINKPALIPWAASQERAMVTEAAAVLYAQLAGRPPLEKPAFIAELTTALGTVKAHAKALAQAAEIGTQVHHYIEWILRKDLGQIVGAAPDLSPKALVAYQIFNRWRDGVRLIPQRIEQQIWSAIHGYAGTLDLLASITVNGERCTAVLDWKSGKAIYPEALLQNAAYVHALTEMGHVTGPVHGVIVRLPKVESDPEPEVSIISPNEQAGLLEVFLEVKRLWVWLQEQERARQDARTRPAPGIVAKAPERTVTSALTPAPATDLSEDTARRAGLLAQITEAKAQLARQPTDAQWAMIVTAHCGADPLQTASAPNLRDVLTTVTGLLQKKASTIEFVRMVLSAGHGAAVEAQRATSAREQATPAGAPVPDPVINPAEAAMLVAVDDPREAILTALAAAKGQLERQPPDAVWGKIVLHVCGGTGDLTTADMTALNDLLQLTKGLGTKDAHAIERTNLILMGVTR